MLFHLTRTRNFWLPGILFTGLSISPGIRCVSYDGDADRIVYYYVDKGIITLIIL